MKTRDFLLSAAVFFFLLPSAFSASLEIDKDKSFIKVDVEVFPTHSFTSELNDYNAEILLSDDLVVEGAAFDFLFDDLDSQSAGRDKRMRKWINTKKHPKVTFELSRIREENGQKIGVGDLWMHGVFREVEIPLTFTANGNDGVLEGSSSIDHLEWGLKKIRFLMFSVNPALTIKIRFEGKIVL